MYSFLVYAHTWFSALNARFSVTNWQSHNSVVASWPGVYQQTTSGNLIDIFWQGYLCCTACIKCCSIGESLISGSIPSICYSYCKVAGCKRAQWPGIWKHACCCRNVLLALCIVNLHIWHRVCFWFITYNYTTCKDFHTLAVCLSQIEC